MRPMTRGTLSLLMGLGLALALALGGCKVGLSTPDNVLWTRVSEPVLEAGDPLPAPGGPVVLTLTGRLTVTNGGGALRLDMATLEALGRVSMRAHDPVVAGREALFEGVLLSTLLAVAGMHDDAAILHAFALDDTQANIPVSDVRALPVLLATRMDGHALSIDLYGPLRIVYPFGQIPLQPIIHEARAIGHVAHIEVR
jgi:hypothetical protein